MPQPMYFEARLKKDLSGLLSMLKVLTRPRAVMSPSSTVTSRLI
jgi:hypothetical protein